VRNKVFGRKLGRDTDTRKALLRSIVAAVVKNGSIITTKPKAKFVQGFVDKLVVLVKKDTLAARRMVFAKLGNDKTTTQKLFGDYKLSFGYRKSGFTRIVNLPKRKGDRASIVRLEFVDRPVAKKTVEAKKIKVGLTKPQVKKE